MPLDSDQIQFITEQSGPSMNPANSEPDEQVANLRHTVSTQGAMLGHHDQTLRGIMDSLAASLG